jgi:hypothetical protein
VPPALQASLLGASGVDRATGATALRPAANEYEICFKCHANSTNKPQTNSAYSVYGRTVVRQTFASVADPHNIRLDFNTTLSRHNVTQPRYQVIANGAYQAPWGIDLGANYLVRQGYPMPWYTRVDGDILSSKKSVLVVPSFTDSRLPIVHQLDLRVGKNIKLSGVQIDVDFDVFNALNHAMVLGRQYDLSRTTGNTGAPNVLEIMQPRIARVGLRVTF